MSSPRSHSKFRAELNLKLSSQDFRSGCFLCLGTDSSGALEDVHIHPFTSPVLEAPIPHSHFRGLKRSGHLWLQLPDDNPDFATGQLCDFRHVRLRNLSVQQFPHLNNSKNIYL